MVPRGRLLQYLVDVQQWPSRNRSQRESGDIKMNPWWPTSSNQPLHPTSYYLPIPPSEHRSVNGLAHGFAHDLIISQWLELAARDQSFHTWASGVHLTHKPCSLMLSTKKTSCCWDILFQWSIHGTALALHGHWIGDSQWWGRILPCSVVLNAVPNAKFSLTCLMHQRVD